MCKCKLHFNDYLFIIVWINSTKKAKKIGFQNMLMKPQFTFTNEFQTKFGIK